MDASSASRSPPTPTLPTDSAGQDLGCECSHTVVVLALYLDAFVCRHFARDGNKWVDGFAQPYDIDTR